MKGTLTGLVSLAALALAGTAQAAETTSLNQGWQARIAPGEAAAKDHPREAQWFGVAVPGTVQQALVEQKRVPDPYLGTNEAAIQWAGLTAWDMRRTLTVTPAMLAHGHLDLVFDGIDTFATVLVNGQAVLKTDNAHRAWRVNARPFLHAGENVVTVQLASPIRTLQPMVLRQAHPLPGEYDSAYGDEPKGIQTSPYIRKPKYQYGWDWGPRIVTIGLWHDVRLEAWDEARLAGFEVHQDALGEAQARLTAALEIEADRAGAMTLEARVTTPDGTVLAPVRQTVQAMPGRHKVGLPLTIDAPQRWWPVGLGAQPLYRVSVTVVDGVGAGQSATRSLGLREVELIRGQGAFGFKVNGVPVFAKGANLIPFDNFPSRVTAQTMERMLADAKAANMNMVRVWGGGTYLDDAFYDAADRLGLMIWQDFMFGGSVTPPDAAFRDSVAAEAAEQVARLGSHPSIVLWAGGNEVLSGWANWSDRKDFKKAVGPDEQERIATGMTVLFDRVLRDAVRDHAFQSPYWPGSPSTDYDGPVDTDAAGDRHFWDVWSGSKPVEAYLATCPRFMSEYGFQSMPGMATITGFAGTGVSDPESPVMKAHQKFLAGEGNARLKFYLDARLRPVEGKSQAALADFAYLTQVNQMQAIDMAARHHRACAPVTMGSLYWQLNDSWPAISWASIDHNGRWKLLHYGARRFFAPQAVVAEARDGATRLALVSDAQAPTPAHWRLTGRGMDGAVLGTVEGDATLKPGGVTEAGLVPDAQVFGGKPAGEAYGLAELIVGGQTVSRQIVERAAPKAMAYPDPGLTLVWKGRQVTVTAQRLARAVMLDFGTLDAAADDNGFDLLPGESRTLTIAGTAADGALRRALVLRTLARKP